MSNLSWICAISSLLATRCRSRKYPSRPPGTAISSTVAGRWFAAGSGEGRRSCPPRVEGVISAADGQFAGSARTRGSGGGPAAWAKDKTSRRRPGYVARYDRARASA
jgi:hypothetical protein